MAAGPSSPTVSEPVPPEQGSRLGLAMICAVAALLLAVNLFGGQDPSSVAARPPQGAQAAAPVAPSTTPAGPSAAPTASQAGRSLPRARPVRLIIPKISVDAPFTDLTIERTGQLEAPPAADTNLVGWHAQGTSPGEAGTAIIAGHVDTATSPAVFAGLGELKKGDTFKVLRADGRTAHFVVDSAETFAKNDFPDRRVYSDTPRAEVRLITCAGDYDRSVRDYTDNLVVFAHLV
ncbi:class F sortase [Streptomyces sp. NPDC006332]|uniref:class F sortase n=1 Tax=Streptomyces sp. NPDC006332 TaxID=3155456 RepID=UPI0033ABD2E0